MDEPEEKPYKLEIDWESVNRLKKTHYLYQEKNGNITPICTFLVVICITFAFAVSYLIIK